MSMPEHALLSILKPLAPSIAGALISLQFIPHEAGKANRFVSFLSGVVIAYYLGGGVIDWFNVTGVSASAINFSCGLFGLTTISHLWVEIPKALAAARVKYLGS